MRPRLRCRSGYFGAAFNGIGMLTCALRCGSRPRSSYYQPPVQTGDDTAIVEAIAAICDEFEQYGWRRVRVRKSKCCGRHPSEARSTMGQLTGVTTNDFLCASALSRTVGVGLGLVRSNGDGTWGDNLNIGGCARLERETRRATFINGRSEGKRLSDACFSTEVANSDQISSPKRRGRIRTKKSGSQK
jgi:hypothetical protein